MPCCSHVRCQIGSRIERLGSVYLLSHRTRRLRPARTADGVLGRPFPHLGEEPDTTRLELSHRLRKVKPLRKAMHLLRTNAQERSDLGCPGELDLHTRNLGNHWPLP